jgi:hypothetical protein
MTTFYRKVGRRYQPVEEYDPELMDALPEGDHLISVRPGLTSCRYAVDPALAHLIAAGVYAEDAISRAIYKAMELRPQKTVMNARQLELMTALTEEFGREDAAWIRPCAGDAARAGVAALQQEAQRRMYHPAVKEAYQRFLVVAKLAEQHDTTTD